MGKSHKRKGDLRSESCSLKNLLKYASYASWEKGDNEDLLLSLATTITTNATSHERGWMRGYFGIELVSDLESSNEILLMVSALLAHECSINSDLRDDLHYSWDKTIFFQRDMRHNLSVYLTSVGQVPKDDLELADGALDDLCEAFSNPFLAVAFIRDHPTIAGLRKTWIKATKKQMKPIEVKVFRLLLHVCCLGLLGRYKKKKA